MKLVLLAAIYCMSQFIAEAATVPLRKLIKNPAAVPLQRRSWIHRRRACPVISTARYLNEDAALRELYASSGGSNWSSSEGWLQGTSHCDWYGVTCSNCNEQLVTELVLNDNNVKGTLPHSLQVLTGLVKMYTVVIDARLRHCDHRNFVLHFLSGTVPANISALTALQYL